ncbi:MAG: phosphoribosyltransferase family protein, partial [Kangiellaceae bacterium]|nr:phosphoribosyltransferase family protein [Kangiellaceae bacterium]
MFNSVEDIKQSADCLYDLNQIGTVIDQIAQQINQQHQATRPIILCVMNGGLVFSGQLLPKLTIPLE